jgi:hypothetical protein
MDQKLRPTHIANGLIDRLHVKGLGGPGAMRCPSNQGLEMASQVA